MIRILWLTAFTIGTFNYIFLKQIVVQNAVVSHFVVNNIDTLSSITKLKFCRDLSYAVFKMTERRVVND